MGWNLVLGVYLMALGWHDARKGQVPLSWLGLGGALVLLQASTSWLFGDVGFADLAQSLCEGLIPGVLLLGLAWVTQKIGTGDGCALMVVGGMAGIGRCLGSFCCSLALSAFYAMVLLAVKKVSRKHCFPYLPFLAAGFWLEEAMRLLG